MRNRALLKLVERQSHPLQSYHELFAGRVRFTPT
jgi:hypothetical protein